MRFQYPHVRRHGDPFSTVGERSVDAFVTPRVLHVIPAVAARYGGPSEVVMATVQRLRARGVETLIATTDADGDRRLPVEIAQPTHLGDVPIIFFRRDASEAFKWSRGLARWLRARVADFDLVDIHAVFSHSSLAAARACSRSGVPYVVRPHGALNPWGLARKRWQKHLLMAAGARRMLCEARAVVYTSRKERELAERAFSWLPAGAIVPPGVDGPDDVAEPAAARHHESPYFLVLSRLAASKRIDLVVRAFDEFAAASPGQPYRLVIAGAGEPRVTSQLKQLASQGAGGSRIEFHGWVAGREKEGLLSGASMLVAPSHQESFGLSIVEAMSRGVPVVTSADVDLAADITTANAGWVVDANPSAVARIFGEVVSRPEELDRRGAAARRVAAAYGWSASIRQLQALYGQVLDREPAALPRVVLS